MQIHNVIKPPAAGAKKKPAPVKRATPKRRGKKR
jgi:hypothetical protein